MKNNHFKLENIGDYAGFEQFKIQFLKRNRLNWIGGGAYSDVYSTGINARFVYKICEDFSLDSTDGYMVYLKNIVLENQGNPFVPKIYGINTYEYIDEHGQLRFRAIIKMERLIDYRSLTKKYRKKLLSEKYGIELGGTDYYGDDRWLSNMNTSVHSNDHLMRYFGGVSVPSLLYIITEIGRSVNRYADINPDIHDGNIMWRERGRNHELVIVDPLS
jgi:hypothetical protein